MPCSREICVYNRPNLFTRMAAWTPRGEIMTIRFLRVGLVTAACGFTIACSSAPTETAKAEKELKAIVETPVTGKTAFWEMYKLGHAWAPDMQVLYLKSGKLEGVDAKAKDGEATEWTLMVASPSKK